MADEIEVHFESGHLSLSCGDEAFARLRDAVLSEARETQAIAGPLTTVRVIEITLVTTERPVGKLRDRFVLLGCSLIGFLLMFAFIVGIATIVGWVR